MKLHGNIDILVEGEEILRRPGLWDKLRQKLGGAPDLRTGQRRAQLEAATVVNVVREALTTLGARNAISLVIDDQVLFRDRDGRDDDLGDLFLAFHDNASVFGGDFKMLRLAIEHEEVGLHLVLEVVARTEHPEGEPAARMVVSGRIRDFEPRSGEDAEAYRARVEPLTKDGTRIELARRQFESFVARVRDALARSMPEARIDIRAAEAQLTRPGRRALERPSEPAPPTDPRYDPFMAYYPSPLEGVLSAMMWASIFSMAMRPDVVVINEAGDAVGHAADLTAADADAGQADAGGGEGHEGEMSYAEDPVDYGDYGDGGDGGGFDDLI